MAEGAPKVNGGEAPSVSLEEVVANREGTAVADQSAEAQAQNGEAMNNVKPETARELGKDAVILTKMDGVDEANAVNKAVEKKMNQGVTGQILKKGALFANIGGGLGMTIGGGLLAGGVALAGPIAWAGTALISAGLVAKPIIAAHFRAKASSKVRQTGNVADAYNALGVEADGAVMGADNNDRVSYSEKLARIELERSASIDANGNKTYANKLDSENSGLGKGEKIERDTKAEEIVNGELKNLFDKLTSAKNHGDDQAYKEAIDDYSNKVDAWSRSGEIGKEKTVKNAKVRVAIDRAVTFFGGDQAVKKLGMDNAKMDLSGLKELVPEIEKMAKSANGENAINEYLGLEKQQDGSLKATGNGRLSLYNASMKEGLNRRQHTDNIMAAVGALGVVGGVTYAVVNREAIRDGRSIVNKFVSSWGNVGTGALFGAITGGLRGLERGRTKLSQAESDAATDADAILSTESSDESLEANVSEAEGDINRSQKKFALLRKVNSFKDEHISHETQLLEEIKGLRDRKSAKELFDTLDINSAVLKFMRGNADAMPGDAVNFLRWATQYAEMNLKGDQKTQFTNTIKGGVDGIRQIDKSTSVDPAERGKVMDAFMNDLNNLFTPEMRKTIGNNAEAKLRETLAEAQARDKVSADMGIDLISYSKGNVAKEKTLLKEKMLDIEKTFGLKAKNESIEKRMSELREKSEIAVGKEKEFRRRQVLVGAINGALTGAVFSALAIGASKAGNHFVGKKDTAESAVSDDSNTGENATENADGSNAEAANVAGVAETANAAETSGEVVDNGPQLTDEDGNGVYELKVGNETVVSEADGGIKFDPETGKMDEGSMNLLRERGFEINETAETSIAHGARTTEGISVFFSKENVDAYNNTVESGNRVVDVNINGYVAADGANRAVDMSQVSFENDGDIVFQVTPKGENIDVDSLQVVLSPSSEMGGTGIVLDVAADGTVTIPADSVAASMFSAEGNFSGGAMRVVQEAADGNGGFNVLGTSFGSNSLTEVGFTNPAEKITYAYSLNGVAFNVPGDAQVESTLANIGAESLRDSGPVSYTYQQTLSDTDTVAFAPEAGYRAITVNGVSANDSIDAFAMPVRHGNYSEALDPFLSDNKDAEALNGASLVRKLIDPDYEMTEAQANQAFIDAMNAEGDLRLDTGTVVNAYLEEVGNSPEQIVEMRAMLGGFEWDIDGDGVPELIDTQEEINAVADIIKNSADGGGYSAFVNDTYERLFAKLNGGEVRVVDYSTEPYDYTTLGRLDKLTNNVLHIFAPKKATPTGVGIEFLDKDGNSVYDFEVARKVWRLPSNARLAHITERMNCQQKTADVNWIRQAAAREVEETVTQPTQSAPAPVQPVQTVTQTTPSEPSQPSTPTTPVTPVTPEPTPPTPDNPTPPTPTPLAGKTDTNSWEGNNPAIMQEPTAPITEDVVQAGQETIPEVDTSNVNLNPEDQVSWAEAPSEPVIDTGIAPEDVSPDTNAEAAEMLRQAEEAARQAVSGTASAAPIPAPAVEDELENAA